MLTRLDSPSERLMRRNGLVEEPSGCIHSCHHHLNPGLLNLQLWPPAWMGNDLSMFAWHPLLLQWNFSSCSHKNTHLNADLSTWVGKFFLMQALACHALRPYLNCSSMPSVTASMFPKEGSVYLFTHIYKKIEIKILCVYNLWTTDSLVLYSAIQFSA